MGRPRVITDDELLAAARALFLEKGITATTAEVAARCGIGEATLFRRFPNKMALFLAAVDPAEGPDWTALLQGRADEPDTKKALIGLGREFIAYGRKMVPLQIMRMSNAGVTHELMRRRKPLIERALTVLRGFFGTLIRRRRLAIRDPRVATRIFIGALQSFVMLEAFGVSDGVSETALLEHLAELFVGTIKEPKLRNLKASVHL